MPYSSLVSVDEPVQGEMVYIAFDNIQSMIRVRHNGNGSYTSNKLPKGEAITIIGIKVENGRPQMAKFSTKIGANNQFTLDYQPSNLKEMRKTLEELAES